MIAVMSGGGRTPAFTLPPVDSGDENTAVSSVLLFTFVALVFAGLSLLFADVWRVLRMHLEGSDGVVEKRWPQPGFRWGGLTRRGVPTAEMQSHERGDA